MSIFKFTTPDGQQIEVKGPPAGTFDQAKAIFEKQLNTGSLAGLKAGDSLSAATQAAAGLGTAISQIKPNLQSITGSLPDLRGVAINNPIGAADFVGQEVSQASIGTLNSTQVQGLVSQAGAAVGQASDVITNEKGLGKFGLDANQLQLSGLIKPGVAEQIAQNPAQLTSILQSPAVWTGVAGATSLAKVLGDVKLQGKVQQGLMDSNLSQLKQLGAIDGTESAEKLGPLLQNATKFGTGPTMDWAKGQAPGNLVNQLNETAKQADFSQSFADANAELAGGGNPLQAGIQKAKGFAKTVDRATINAGVASIVGNSKIPTINPGSFYSNTKDEDLTYTGTDELVLARVNEERANRGLSLLPEPAKQATAEEKLKAAIAASKADLDKLESLSRTVSSQVQADDPPDQIKQKLLELNALYDEANSSTFTPYFDLESISPYDLRESYLTEYTQIKKRRRRLLDFIVDTIKYLRSLPNLGFALSEH